MVRLLPSFVTGILCNVLIALLVGRVPVVYLIGKHWVPRCYPPFKRTVALNVYRSRHASDGIWEHLLLPCQGRPDLLVVRLSQCGNCSIRSGFCVLEWDVVHRQVRSPSRAERGGSALHCHDTGMNLSSLPLSSRLGSLPCRDGARMTFVRW